jgi:hypothetical protein
MRWRWALISAALTLIVVWVGAMLLERPIKVRPQLGWAIIDKTGEGYDTKELIIEGTWTGDGDPHEVNVAHIQCRLKEQVCEQHQATLSSLLLTDFLLTMTEDYFDIKSIDANYLTAVKLYHPDPWSRSMSTG